MENKITHYDTQNTEHRKRVLLVITGGIAAYKSLDVIRKLKEQHIDLQIVMTENAHQFVTEMSVAALAGVPVRSHLFSSSDETQMGHIDFARWADLIVICPASANFLAKMATGLADDLASTLCLATNVPVMAMPAMNPQMWQHPATQSNIKVLEQRGVHVLMPEVGEMACGETGRGRLPETDTILKSILTLLYQPIQQLVGRKCIVTSGPTREAIDPVRYISNHSSGKQGHALANALQQQGADVILITGPCEAEIPMGVSVIPVVSAQEMADAMEKNLPADIVICAAAVADWRVTMPMSEKMKKNAEDPVTALTFVENPDILANVAQHQTQRPNLVIGFAAETQDVLAQARQKRQRKGCDWLIANDVSADDTGNSKVFGRDENQIHFIAETVCETWEKQTKQKIANHLVQKIVAYFRQDEKRDDTKR